MIGQVGARQGFTLTEVLVAAAIGMAVMGLAIDQVMKYFRLQQSLITRAELRQELKVAQQQLFAKLRYANHLVPQTDAFNLIVTIPIDRNGNGMLDPADTMQVVWWRVAPDALAGATRSPLIERVIETPAFEPGSDIKSLEALFAKVPGQGRQIAPRFSSLTITETSKGLFNVELSASVDLPQTHQQVTQTLVEKVAARSLPLSVGLPDVAEVAQDLGVTR